MRHWSNDARVARHVGPLRRETLEAAELKHQLEYRAECHIAVADGRASYVELPGFCGCPKTWRTDLGEPAWWLEVGLSELAVEPGEHCPGCWHRMPTAPSSPLSFPQPEV